jgi:hypothetical protein
LDAKAAASAAVASGIVEILQQDQAERIASGLRPIDAGSSPALNLVELYTNIGLQGRGMVLGALVYGATRFAQAQSSSQEAEVERAARIFSGG